MNGMTTSRISRIAVAGIAALTLATGAVALSGCGDSSSTSTQTTTGESSTGTASTQTTTGESSTGTAYTRDSTSITAKVGDTFVIQLATNPSPDYQWQLASSGDPGVLSYPGAKTSTDVENWTFTAEMAGTHTLEFSSVTTPVGDTPVDMVTFDVTVTS